MFQFFDAPKTIEELRTLHSLTPPYLERVPAQNAIIAYDALMAIAKLMEVPIIFAMKECAMMASKSSGFDLTKLLPEEVQNAPHPTPKAKEVMLLPCNATRPYTQLLLTY